MSESVHVRERKRSYAKGSYDPYYATRYLTSTPVDDRLLAIRERMGEDIFTNKRVLDIGCGSGLVSFQISALCGASHVLAIDRDLETILLNLKQLRKYKHDGIKFTSNRKHRDEEYPTILVKRNGTVRCTNKAWYLPNGIPGDSKFPFNIEFRCCDVVESLSFSQEKDQQLFDIVICFKVAKFVPKKIELGQRIFSFLKPGGFLLTDTSLIGEDDFTYVSKLDRGIFIFQRAN